jgi:hypothetical protein
MYVPPKGRQGENHISKFSEFIEGEGMMNFCFFFKISLITPQMGDNEKNTLINSKSCN